MKYSKLAKKTWNFLWHSNSIWSWIANVIIAFVLVKFLIYPGLGLLLGTTHPIVAVVSESMEHDGNFDEWWQTQESWYTTNGFLKEEVRNWKFSNGFNKGDIMILLGTGIDDINKGDVVVFRGNSRDPIIHRVVKIFSNSETFVQTKGDNNADTFTILGEDRINKDRLIGKAVFKIPLLGWIKILFVEIIGGL